MDLNTLAAWLGRLLTLGYAALVLAELARYFRTALVEPVAPPPPARAPAPWPRLLAQALLAFAASRLLVAAACAACYAVQNHTLDGFLPALWGRLTPWDAGHYLGLIENGYVTEGDAALHLVFLPFYPMLCRALRWLTGLSPLATALLVSNGALVGCALALFRLVETDDGPVVARRAALLMMFNPMTYFYSLPYTESVFLLTTLLAVLFARRRRWGWAVLFGAMAANTRIVGIAVAIPIFWQMLRADREAAAERGEADTPGATARRVALCVLRVLPVAAGLLVYLNLNYRLYGSATQFLVYQREHWHQSFGSMANTFRYSLYNSIFYHDPLYQLGIWRPTALLLVALPALVAWRRKREPVADTAYLLVYHYVSFAPTWLLSGPRYCSAAYPLYPMLARVPRGRKGFAALLAAEMAAMAYFAVVGLWFVKVY